MKTAKEILTEMETYSAPFSQEEVVEYHDLEQQFLKICTEEEFEGYFLHFFLTEGTSDDYFRRNLKESGRTDLTNLLEVCIKGTEIFNPLEGSFEWDFQDHCFYKTAE